MTTVLRHIMIKQGASPLERSDIVYSYMLVGIRL